MTKADIMIVEDEFIIQNELKATLKELGYQVTVTASGAEEAIEKAGEHNPDIILMDIQIKGKMDGIEAAAVIKKNFNTPIVFITAFVDDEKIERAKLNMPYGYLVKPVMARDLRITLEMALYASTVEAKRKQTIEALRESEKRFREVINQAADSIFIHNFQGEFLDANKKACESLGYTHQELLKMNVMDIEIGSQNLESLQSIWNGITQGHHVSMEGLQKRKDNTTFQVEVRLGLLSVKGEKQIVAIARDATERKKAEEERERLIKELQEAFDSIKTLKGLLPICANCKKIRDDGGYWNQIESFIESHSDALFSHGICPDCYKKLYPDVYEKMKKAGKV
ncbi:PAS domain S-box protein [bacterium]|nr:PAS domain S-box protein [bacterium]